MKVDIEKLLELEALATNGPWTSAHNNRWQVKGKDYVICNVTISFSDPPTDEPDAELIVAMRQNIVSLCRELQVAREVCDAAKVGNNCGEKHHCGCSNHLVKEALKKYDEVR